MAGCSLSLFKMSEDHLALIDAPTNALAWPRGGRVGDPGDVVVRAVQAPVAKVHAGCVGSPELRVGITAAAKALLDAEPLLTELDTKSGDGDLGSSLSRGADAIMALPESVWEQDPTQVLHTVGETLRRAIGGSSGPFYATALMRAARSLEEQSTSDLGRVADAFALAVESISRLGGASVGDRTMIDALAPASAAFRRSIEAGESARVAWSKAALAAESGALTTTSMKPRLGRASYLGDRAVGAPDGGAKAVAIWIAAVAAAQA
jgi:dihydroxyacetone kinase